MSKLVFDAIIGGYFVKVYNVPEVQLTKTSACTSAAHNAMLAVSTIYESNNLSVNVLVRMLSGFCYHSNVFNFAVRTVCVVKNIFTCCGALD